MHSEASEMKPFSEILKKLMEERGVTAAVLSRATDIPRNTISEWLSQTRKEPRLNESIVRLAKFFGVPVEYLVMGVLPEQEIMSGVLEDLDSGFVSIHQGVYRINVEKFSGKKNSTGGKK